MDYSFFGRVPGRHYFWFDHLNAGVKEEAAKFFSHRLFYNLCFFLGEIGCLLLATPAFVVLLLIIF